jgi:hypothetical protein
MKSVKTGAGYGNLTVTPHIGAGSQCRTKVFKNGTVWLNADDVEKALKEFTECGNDGKSFWLIIRKFRDNALETAHPPKWLKDWYKEQRSQSIVLNDTKEK